MATMLERKEAMVVAIDDDGEYDADDDDDEDDEDDDDDGHGYDANNDVDGAEEAYVDYQSCSCIIYGRQGSHPSSQ